MYDGTDDLEEYITQLNLFSELNNWIAVSKALCQQVEWGARALLNEMSDYEFHNYEDLAEALKSRSASVNRADVSRSELQTRVRMRNDTIPELAQTIKRCLVERTMVVQLYVIRQQYIIVLTLYQEQKLGYG